MDEVRVFRDSSRAFAAFLACRDGLGAGRVAAGVLPAHRNRAWTRLTVLQEHRRNGVGTALYRMISDWLLEQGIDRIRTPVAEDDSDSLAFAERRGFRESERSRRMVLDLAAVEAAPIHLPAGIELTSFAKRPGLARAIYEVACEALPDVPGEEDWEELSFEEWLPQLEGSGGGTTLVALAQGEVIGYGRLAVTAAQPTVAFHDMTGVKRAWRRRGIAGALKRAQMHGRRRRAYNASKRRTRCETNRSGDSIARSAIDRLQVTSCSTGRSRALSDALSASSRKAAPAQATSQWGTRSSR
jgi:GNAT superfamily N-acetyltransferase